MFPSKYPKRIPCASAKWFDEIYTYLYIFIHIYTYLYIFIHIYTYLYIFIRFILEAKSEWKWQILPNICHHDMFGFGSNAGSVIPCARACQHQVHGQSTGAVCFHHRLFTDQSLLWWNHRPFRIEKNATCFSWKKMPSSQRPILDSPRCSCFWPVRLHFHWNLRYKTDLHQSESPMFGGQIPFVSLLSSLPIPSVSSVSVTKTTLLKLSVQQVTVVSRHRYLWRPGSW